MNFLTSILSEIICSIIGLIIGGACGYSIGVRNKIKQVQKAGDNAKQTTVGSVNINVQR